MSAAFTPRLGNGLAHHGDRGCAAGMRLRQVMQVGSVSVAGQFAENLRAACLRVGFRFQHRERRRFAEHQAVTGHIERTAAVGTHGLQTIKTNVDQFGQCLVAAGQHTVARTGSDQVRAVADGVGPAGAGIGDDRHWPAKAQMPLEIVRLMLCLVSRSAVKFSRAAMLGEHGPQELFPQRHCASRGADGKRQLREGRLSLAIQQPRIRQRFAGGGKGESAGTGQTRQRFRRKVGKIGKRT